MARRDVIHSTPVKPPTSWAGKGPVPGLAQDILPTSSTIGPNGTIASIERATIQVRLKPGMYDLICGVYGHAQAGMDIPFRVVAGSGQGDPPPLPDSATQLADSPHTTESSSTPIPVAPHATSSIRPMPIRGSSRWS